MINSNEYIFFEADQVLTNDHLNESFNYLDHQNRWTRNKLIGIGIACGLEIVINNTGIEITKGCGVTSQGYLIVQHKEEYTYYMKYSPIAIPKDLPFKHGTDLPFYEGYNPGKQLYLLLTDDQQKALEPAKKSAAIAINTKNGFLDDYAVALFLEMKETDLKNCDMQDCNNEGEQIVFTVRPLLVPIADLVSLKNGSPDKIKLTSEPHILNLKRYNVPYKPITDSQEVLQAFYAIVDNAILNEVAIALKYCYEEYGYLLKVTVNPFKTLAADLKKLRDHIFKLKPVFIEYFYDFIDDLIKAYYELVEKAINISVCCPDADLFPLHLILGSASQSTDIYVKDIYRDYFMYSGLFSKMEGDAAEATLLFQRIVVMLEEFAIQTETEIKITPSQYEWPPLSARAIPYYYYKGEELKITETNRDRLGGLLTSTGKKSTKLYKYWNYQKTIKKEETLNLSYNADTYTKNIAITEPLLYDIEKYNFFRIEGHIGENYQRVLERILLDRLTYNLPFDVVAVSAEQLRLATPLPKCNMQDLETAYKLILGEAACKIHTLFCYMAQMPYRSAFNDTVGDIDKAKLDTEKGLDTTVGTGVYSTGWDATFSAYKITASLQFETPVAISTTYQRGDFLRKNCKPREGTLGFAYLNSLSKKGIFSNPLQQSLLRASKNQILLNEYHYFMFIEAVEELMFVLQTHALAEINVERLVEVYRNYLRLAIQVLRLLEAQEDADDGETTTDPAGNTIDYISFLEERELSALADEMGIILAMCIDERIDVLKREYVDRLRAYQQQLTFLNYYKKHPGLEHKAGVPKGGTFVLVYHGEISRLNEPVNAIGGGVYKRLSDEPSPTGTVIDEPIAYKPLPYNDDLTKMIRKLVDECKEASPKLKNTITIGLEEPTSVVTTGRGIINDAVIADFYIPYLCCSDCPPVAYIMNEPRTTKPKPPVTEKPTIDPAGPFCSDDTDKVQLTGKPVGGTFGDVNGAPIPGIDNTAGTLVPAVFGPGSFDVYYSVAGVSSDKMTMVILNDSSDFSFTQVSVKQRITEVTFNAANTAAGVKYNWQMITDSKDYQADVASEDTANFNVRFIFGDNEPSDATIVLTVGIGGCKSAIQKTFSFSFNQQENGFDIHQNDS